MQEPADRSARVIVPIVMEVARPQSVVDIGCGLGQWLQVFSELGVSDVIGVDGSTVPTELLKISPQQFHVVDLAREEVDLGRRFDLAVSLEVGEHLPAARAKSLVGTLTSLAPVVMFGAAIPLQGGTTHVNEQWPDYWAALFAQHGYVLCDVFRPRLWTESAVAYWYAQNTFLYVREDRLDRLGLQNERGGDGRVFPLRAVHPDLLWAYAVEGQDLPVRAMRAARRLAFSFRDRLPRSAR